MFPLLALLAPLTFSDIPDTALPTAAVVAFDARGVPPEQVAILEDRFRFELGSMGAFRLLERQKMDGILREQGFQQSGCVSTECAVETGRVLGVRRMIAGSVAHLGSTWSLSAREIEVETGEIRRSAVVDMQESVDAVLTRGMHDLAGRLVDHRAPVVTASNLFEGLGASIANSIGSAVAKDSSAPRSQPLVEPPPPPGTIPFQLVLAVVPLPPARSVNGVAVDAGWGRVEQMRGIQAGVVNQVDSALFGIQAGVLNLSGTQRGIQAGLINASTGARGLQAGGANFSGPIVGIQAGVVNIAGEVDGGFQVGLVNVWKKNGVTRVFPVFGGLF